MIKKLEWDGIKDNGEAIYFLRKKVDEIVDRLNEMEPQEEKPQEEMVNILIANIEEGENAFTIIPGKYPKDKLLAALDSIK